MPARLIKIFDTTLRDGEQSPGASMNIEEKLNVAKQLARLKVDVIEAGFPISSQGDFDAVKAVAELVKGPAVAGLCRANFADIDRAWEALRKRRKPRDPHVHSHQRYSSREEAQQDSRAGAGHRRRGGQAGKGLLRRCGVLCRGRRQD